MLTTSSILATPIKINTTTIKNRLVMPPSIMFGWSDNQGKVTPKHLKHYEEKAAEGIGLIIVEATSVMQDGRLSDSQLGLWNDDQIEGMANLVNICHKYNAKIVLQLHHAGRLAPPSVTAHPWGPISQSFLGRKIQGATPEKLNEILDSFINAAVRAFKAGFDGIELHCCYGSFLNQMVSPLANKRTDEYGGNLKNRLRFTTKIITNIRSATSPDFIIGCRVGCNEPTYQEGISISQGYELAGADYLNVSAGLGDHTNLYIPKDFPYNSMVYGASLIKKHVNIPVITLNSLEPPQKAAWLIEKGMADLISLVWAIHSKMS